LQVHDEPAAWNAAGFVVSEDGTVRIGAVGVELVGREGRPKGGLRAWGFSGLPAGTEAVDGIPTVDAPPPEGPAVQHPNGARLIDHVVIVTPQRDRTVGAFERVGLDVRRVRETDQYGPPFTQTFFRAGEAILELIGAAEPAEGDDRPAHLYGIALTVRDLDATAALLGDGLGTVKDAVQPGRRIATLRTGTYGISCAVALMSAGAGSV
jgi:hypothetical protein